MKEILCHPGTVFGGPYGLLLACYEPFKCKRLRYSREAYPKSRKPEVFSQFKILFGWRRVHERVAGRVAPKALFVAVLRDS
jgi:hypothetical protein